MPGNTDDKTYYERLRQTVYNNRLVAWLLLIAVVGLGVIKYYNELTAAVHQAWKQTGTVQFTTPHTPLLKSGKIEIERDSHAVRVVDFNKLVVIEFGPYNAAAFIDNRVLLKQPFMVESKTTEVVRFEAHFAVKGIVVNGQGKPLANVFVQINDRRAKTKNDGLFVLDDLPMQRTYDIAAHLASGGAFTAQHPWTGTVYNGNWDTTITQNIALVR